jgi:hypothetical protein
VCRRPLLRHRPLVRRRDTNAWLIPQAAGAVGLL